MAAGEREIAGRCHVLFAYEVGFSVDLDACERLLQSATRTKLRDRRRGPRYVDYEPPPLRVTVSSPPLVVAGHPVETSVECILYDFGAVSVVYSIPIQGSLASLLPLSDALYDNDLLLAESRKRVEELAGVVGSAITKLDIRDMVEDYAVYHLERSPPPQELGAARSLLARILRSEPGELSEQEIADALSTQLAYSPGDLAIVDWNAALVVAPKVEDVLSVLEFANVELLEVRYLDERLDRLLDRAHAAAQRTGLRHTAPVLNPLTRDLRRLAELQTEAAVLYEQVNNALKLLGDQYLARLYRLAAQRLHIPAWDAIILRKLQTVESIYQKLSDERSSRRLEWLEWIVILLIAIEVVMSLGTHLLP